MSALDLDRRLGALARAAPFRVRGRVTALTGLVVRAAVEGARHGEVVEIRGAGIDPLPAEVVGLHDEEALLLPLAEPRGVGLDAAVVPTGRPLSVRVGAALLGRVLDGLGRPIDGRPLPRGLGEWAVDRSAPGPLDRRRVAEPLPLGVRVLDGFLTAGRGQRLGLFAGSGVGKSTLLGQIARQACSDLSVVCLLGERGREVRDFLEESLGEDGLARSVVVAATSDAPARSTSRGSAENTLGG